MSLMVSWAVRVVMLLWAISSCWATAQMTNNHSIKGPVPLELRQMILGGTCQVLFTSEAGLPCHPAALAREKQNTFASQIYLGEHYDRVNGYRKDIENKNELGLVEKLFEETEPLHVRVGSALWVKSPVVSVAYVPLHVSYYSDFRNRAYPEVDLKILVERSVQIQGAHSVDLAQSQLLLGLQMRGVDRQTLFQNVALFDVLSDPKILQIETHESLFLEPGVIWIHESSWQPRVSLMAQNLQVYQSGAQPPAALAGNYFDLGSGFSVPMSYGQLDLGVNYRNDPQIEEFSERIRFGTGYNLGLMNANFSIGVDQWAIGVSTSFLSARTGVAFFQDNVTGWDGTRETKQTVTLEFGLVF